MKNDAYSADADKIVTSTLSNCHYQFVNFQERKKHFAEVVTYAVVAYHACCSAAFLTSRSFFSLFPLGQAGIPAKEEKVSGGSVARWVPSSLRPGACT
jgi:hypothetical protein